MVCIALELSPRRLSSSAHGTYCCFFQQIVTPATLPCTVYVRRLPGLAGMRSRCSGSVPTRISGTDSLSHRWHGFARSLGMGLDSFGTGSIVCEIEIRQVGPRRVVIPPPFPSRLAEIPMCNQNLTTLLCMDRGCSDFLYQLQLASQYMAEKVTKTKFLLSSSSVSMC